MRNTTDNFNAYFGRMLEEGSISPITAINSITLNNFINSKADTIGVLNFRTYFDLRKVEFDVATASNMIMGQFVFSGIYNIIVKDDKITIYFKFSHSNISRATFSKYDISKIARIDIFETVHQIRLDSSKYQAEPFFKTISNIDLRSFTMVRYKEMIKQQLLIQLEPYKI